MDTQIDTAQRRAAQDMYNRLMSVMHRPQDRKHALARLELFYAVAYREALEAAAKMVNIYNCDHNHGKKATKACDDIVEILDRLREGVRGFRGDILENEKFDRYHHD